MPSLSELYTAFDSDPAAIVGFLQGLAESYDLPQPLSVLDVGCGPGRLLRPLARLQWEVTGLEPAPQFLLAAQEVARENRRVRILPGGFLDIEEEAAFDLVVGMNSSFAHLLLPAERGEALRRIHHALRPLGVVCLDIPNFVWILKNYRAPLPHTSTFQGQNVTLHRRHEIDHHRATFTTTDEYVFEGDRGGPGMEIVHSYGMATLPEIEYHLEMAGFVKMRTFSGYGSRVIEQLNGPRMLVAAQRPAA